jgi:dTDP-4-dehydrorhamnose reductase
LEDPRATSVLVLGACGMLGNAVLRVFACSPGYKVAGTARSSASRALLPESVRSRVVVGVDVENFDSLARVMAQVKPQVVINCIGLVKQLAEADDPLAALPINSLLPHRLARLCELVQARLVHISTDCVFSGARGAYTEDDPPDAVDLYGRSKLLGEVDYPHAVTLRTSIIGHELNSMHGLVGWFLSQRGQVKGFRRAVFSGLPTVVIAKVIRDHVLTHPTLRGLHHVSSAPIDKFELLTLVAKVYGSTTTITPDDTLRIDRSLDSTKFRSQTGFSPDEWPDMVRQMHAFQLEAPTEQA